MGKCSEVDIRCGVQQILEFSETRCVCLYRPCQDRRIGEKGRTVKINTPCLRELQYLLDATPYINFTAFAHSSSLPLGIE
jgi:hypothetical protein